MSLIEMHDMVKRYYVGEKRSVRWTISACGLKRENMLLLSGRPAVGNQR